MVYGAGNGLAALTASAGALIATRALMGVGAAIIFPTTLSIITNVFTERAARARAIGLWGAITGLAVALGPIAGGALLEAFSWQATFLVKVPVALAAIALVALRSCRPRATPRRRALDLAGARALDRSRSAVVVFAIIEAPEAGWASAQTLAAARPRAWRLLAAFVAWERRTRDADARRAAVPQPALLGAPALSVTVALLRAVRASSS